MEGTSNLLSVWPALGVFLVKDAPSLCLASVVWRLLLPLLPPSPFFPLPFPRLKTLGLHFANTFSLL